MAILTDAHKAGIIVALDLALRDQQHWLKNGRIELDYGSEWPTVRNHKISNYHNMAAVARMVHLEHVAQAFEQLAVDVAQFRLGDEDEETVAIAPSQNPMDIPHTAIDMGRMVAGEASEIALPELDEEEPFEGPRTITITKGPKITTARK